MNNLHLPTYETLLTEAISALLVEGGTVTTAVAAGGNSLTDGTKSWQNGIHANRIIKIVKGQGAGQVAFIVDNSRDSLIIRGGWLKAVAAGDTYAIINASEITLSKLIPIAKATLFNQALPAAEANWLVTNITPTNSPSYLRLYVNVAAGGVLRLARTVGGVTIVEDLNHGVPLLANSAYLFTGIEWRTGDSLNIRYSATGANILVLRADEIGGAD